MIKIANLKVGDLIQHKKEPTIILEIEGINHTFGKVICRGLINRSPYHLSYKAVNEHFLDYHRESKTKLEVMTRSKLLETLNSKEFEKVLDNLIDAEFDERAKKLKEMDDMKKPKLTDVLKVGDNVIHKITTGETNRAIVNYIDNVAERVEFQDMVTKKYHTATFKLVNANWTRISPLPKPKPKIPVKVITRIITHTLYRDFYEHTLRDRMYKAYCLRRGRVSEKYDETHDIIQYDVETSPEEIAGWLHDIFDKSIINKIILELHKL